jgi:hypothetical protein
MSKLMIKGKLIKKFEPQTFGESFRKMEFIVETTEDKYPQKIKFQATQDNIQKFQDLTVGLIADWYFNVRGREWTNKENKVVYFVSLDVWNHEEHGTDLTQPLTEPMPETTSESDGLPF